MKKVKLLTMVLIIILITMVAFFGVYVHIQNRMENKVKDYELSMQLKGYRQVSYTVDLGTREVIKDKDGNEIEEDNITDEDIEKNGYTKEEKVYNEESQLNIENYKKSKEILEKRLQTLGVNEYIIKLNEQTGEIIIQLEENDNTDFVIGSIVSAGKFELIDTNTKEVLMNNNDIKLSNVMYGSGNQSSISSTNSTNVYLNIEFNEQGKKKLEEITTKYAKTQEQESTDENSQESTSEDAEENTEENTEENSEENSETKENTITINIDDSKLLTTSFEEPIKTGRLSLTVGSASTDQDTLKNNVEQAKGMATILDSSNMPITYQLSENEYILSDITKDDLQIIEYIILGISLIGLIIFVIRYKTNGLIGAISYIGLLSIFVLLIRYANVVLSIEGIFGIVISMLLNYIFINKLLSKIKKEQITLKEAIKQTYKKFFIEIIPICIMVVTFSLIGWTPISSLGMIMFWGIVLIAVYNFCITYSLLKIKQSK